MEKMKKREMKNMKAESPSNGPLQHKQHHEQQQITTMKQQQQRTTNNQNKTKKKKQKQRKQNKTKQNKTKQNKHNNRADQFGSGCKKFLNCARTNCRCLMCSTERLHSDKHQHAVKHYVGQMKCCSGLGIG